LHNHGHQHENGHGGDAHRLLGDSHLAHERRTLWVVALTAVMMVIEVAAGLLTGSMALLADGIHMATHVGALGIAAAAYAFARRHADDPRFTWGTGKVGDLAGFASALLLAIFALGIGWESTARFFAPGTIAYGEALGIAVLGLVVNLVSAWLLGSGHHHHGGDHGHSHRDHNLRSAYYHVLADAFTSLLAIGALLAGLYLGWRWLDPAVGLLGALVIARWSVGLLRDTAAVLVDASSDRAIEARVRSALQEDGARVRHLHLWRIAPGKHALVVTVEAEQPLAPSECKLRLAGERSLAHITVCVQQPSP
jgi:cation diffusion facilitator family transporter